MRCPKCKGENVSIGLEQVGSKTKKSGVGLAGHTNNLMRGVAAVCTFGMTNAVWKKSVGGEKSKIKNVKVCICQECGYSWNIK